MIDQICQRGWGRNLGLFWLVVIIAIGIVFVVDRFLVAPAMAAEGFGVPIPRSDADAYRVAQGTRDIGVRSILGHVADNQPSAPSAGSLHTGGDLDADR